MGRETEHITENHSKISTANLGLDLAIIGAFLVIFGLDNLNVISDSATTTLIIITFFTSYIVDHIYDEKRRPLIPEKFSKYDTWLTLLGLSILLGLSYLDQFLQWPIYLVTIPIFIYFLYAFFKESNNRIFYLFLLALLVVSNIGNLLFSQTEFSDLGSAIGLVFLGIILIVMGFVGHHKIKKQRVHLRHDY